MKNSINQLITIIFLFCMVTACSSHSGKVTDKVEQANPVTTNVDKLPGIEFEKDFHDFGNLRQGEIVTFSFKFKNTGNSLLLISDVSTSCGCTVSDFPKEPILPGKSGKIDVRFDSEGKRGQQNKMVTVFSNTQPNSTILHIQAMVALPEDQEK